ncbi:MAG: hypothetical protein AB8I08_36355 [Sandaracinaceae bacterium]
MLVGCAENAILELDIIPAEDMGVLDIDVSARTTPLSFDDAAGGFGTSVDRIQLGVGEPPHISVTAEGEEITSPLYIGVGVCPEGAMQCLPTRVFRVERAFYLGQYTHLDLDLRRGPPTGAGIEEISRCLVQGCGSSESDYCYDDADTRRHFCDR